MPAGRGQVVLTRDAPFEDDVNSAGAPRDPEVARWARRLERERRIRAEAESIAARDLCALQARARELALVTDIVTAANEAPDARTALDFAVQRICREHGWSAGRAYFDAEGAAWSPPGETGAAGSACVLSPPGLSPAPPETPGAVGLVGEVLATGKAAWRCDAGDRARRPTDAGDPWSADVRTVLDFPVVIGADVVAVLEFVSKQPTTPDDLLLRVMTQVGAQLGRVIERERARSNSGRALHDPVTGLPNRALFIERLEQAIAAAQAVPGNGQGFAVLFLDLGRFKAVNDGLGHVAADELLARVAHRLTASLRGVDVASHEPPPPGGNRTLGRLGRDEFTILLDDIREPRDAIRIAERILRALDRPFRLASHEVHTTPSIGIAFGDGGSAGAHEILRQADIAMYRAKKRGRSRWEVFDAAMAARMVAELKLENDLYNALERGELRVHYQPVVSLGDGRVRGFEALVRWQHPDRGLVMPGEFVPLAEKTGQICAIDRWVLGEACRQIKCWNDARPSDDPLYVSVNVSAVEFARRDLVQQVIAVLDATGLPADCLKLEITESAAMADPDRTHRQLLELQARGVRFSLDDFGTGFSSLSQLLNLPIHTLKIDRSFVSDIDNNHVKLHVLNTIIELARGLNIAVVAEGAETRGEVGCLNRLRCQYVQGFYFSRPLERNAAEHLLAQPRVGEPADGPGVS